MTQSNQSITVLSNLFTGGGFRVHWRIPRNQTLTTLALTMTN